MNSDSSDKILAMRIGEDGAVAILRQPISCPKCKRMTHVVSNKNGRTMCAGCSEEVHG